MKLKCEVKKPDFRSNGADKKSSDGAVMEVSWMEPRPGIAVQKSHPACAAWDQHHAVLVWGAALGTEGTKDKTKPRDLL